MKVFLKYLTLFLAGGTLYYTLEVLFRGYSFLAMAGCGGLCFVICGVLNRERPVHALAYPDDEGGVRNYGH